MVDIKTAFNTVKEAFDGITAIGKTAVIGLIVLGTLIGAVTTGSITLPTAFNTVLAAFATTMSAWFTSGVGVVTTIIALVVVVVLVKLFKKGKDGDAI